MAEDAGVVWHSRAAHRLWLEQLSNWQCKKWAALCAIAGILLVPQQVKLMFQCFMGLCWPELMPAHTEDEEFQRGLCCHTISVCA